MRRVAAIAVVAALLVAGCGEDSDDEVVATETEKVVTETVTKEPVKTETATTETTVRADPEPGTSIAVVGNDEIDLAEYKALLPAAKKLASVDTTPADTKALVVSYLLLEKWRALSPGTADAELVRRYRPKTHCVQRFVVAYCGNSPAQPPASVALPDLRR